MFRSLFGQEIAPKPANQCQKTVKIPLPRTIDNYPFESGLTTGHQLPLKQFELSKSRIEEGIYCKSETATNLKEKNENERA